MKITNRLIRNILNEIENNLNMRGQTGYGAGHPYQKGTERKVQPIYGKSVIEHEEDEEEVDNKKENVEDETMDKIKISKVFKEKAYE